MKTVFSVRCIRYAGVAYRYFLPVLVWMGVIFLLSAQSSLGIAGRPVSLEYLLIRKSAHIVEYFILGLLLFRLFRFYFPGNSHAIAAGTVLLSLLYAFSDEAHQLLVMGREGRITDVGIDAVGILLSLVFCLAILPRWKRRGSEE